MDLVGKLGYSRAKIFVDVRDSCRSSCALGLRAAMNDGMDSSIGLKALPYAMASFRVHHS